MTLTDFLLARIADDEAVARDAAVDFVWQRDQDFGGFTVKVYDHIARHDPARVLAECEAKRRIVEIHRPLDDDPDPFCWNCDEESWPCKTMSALALPYADHSDYDEAWKV